MATIKGSRRAARTWTALPKSLKIKLFLAFYSSARDISTTVSTVVRLSNRIAISGIISTNAFTNTPSITPLIRHIGFFISPV